MSALRLRGGRIGPFRIVAPIGEGGFAPVFLAVEEHGGVELRTVALKLFAPDELADLTRERIIEEARALCRVEHPNVVRFFQLVEDAAEGVLGLAMEHVRGRSLGDRLDAERVLSVDATLEVGVAVAAALAAVHAAGLVHRDVKPGNVIDAGGVFKLIDFGIALRARASVRGARGVRRAPCHRGVGVRSRRNAGDPRVARHDRRSRRPAPLEDRHRRHRRDHGLHRPCVLCHGRTRRSVE